MNTKNSHINIACIIPTLHNREGVLQLLNDLATLYPTMPVVVVNNNQEAYSFNAQLSNLIVVEQGRNTGFAKACNDGARAAAKHFGVEYYTFVNDDIRCSQPWIKECITELEKQKWFATTPRINRLDGVAENNGYHVLPQGKVLELRPQNDNHELLDGLTAAALVVRRSSFEKLKGFDERFFAYLEDVDLFLRAKKLGYKFGTTETVSVVHQGQGTSSAMPVRKRWLDLRNWYLLIYKNWGARRIMKYFPQIVVERLRNVSGLLKAVLGLAK